MLKAVKYMSNTNSSTNPTLLLNVQSKQVRDSWLHYQETASRNGKLCWRQLTLQKTAKRHGASSEKSAMIHLSQHSNCILLRPTKMLNGRSTTKQPRPKIDRVQVSQNTRLTEPFTPEELNINIKALKNGKAIGLDNMFTEEIKHFGPLTLNLVLELMNNCMMTRNIPKIWRKTKIIALLKPGKDPAYAKNFRPISLLCHPYRLFERLILNRLASVAEPAIIPQQAVFRPGRSTTSQLLNLTQPHMILWITASSWKRSLRLQKTWQSQTSSEPSLKIGASMLSLTTNKVAGDDSKSEHWAIHLCWWPLCNISGEYIWSCRNKSYLSPRWAKPLLRAQPPTHEPCEDPSLCVPSKEQKCKSTP